MSKKQFDELIEVIHRVSLGIQIQLIVILVVIGFK